MHPYSNTDLYDATYASLSLDAPVVVGEFPAGNSSTATLQQYLNQWFNNGYAGAWPWSYKAVDAIGAPDPTTMSNWNNAHLATVNIAPATNSRAATPSGNVTAATRQPANPSTVGTPGTRQPIQHAVMNDPIAAAPITPTAALRETDVDAILAALERTFLGWLDLQATQNLKIS